MGSWSAAVDASAGQQHGLRLRAGPRFDVAQRQLVLRERAGLVRTQDVHAGHLLDGLQPGDDHLAGRQQLGPQGHGHREDGRHRHRHGGHQEDQHELGHPQHGLAARELNEHQDGGQHDGHENEEIADPQDGLLEV